MRRASRQTFSVGLSRFVAAGHRLRPRTSPVSPLGLWQSGHGVGLRTALKSASSASCPVTSWHRQGQGRTRDASVICGSAASPRQASRNDAQFAGRGRPAHFGRASTECRTGNGRWASGSTRRGHDSSVVGNRSANVDSSDCDHARIPLMTFPCTSVSRKSRPAWWKVSFSWSKPRRWRIVA